MQNKITFGFIGILIGIIATWAFANTAVNNYHPGMMGFMGMGSRVQMFNNIDQHFIEQMIPHHNDAITMAQLALQKAEHQEIKDLSQSIIEAQTKENNNMRDWYQNWFGTKVPDYFSGNNYTRGMGYGMMHDDDDDEYMMTNFGSMSDLESANPFDKEFIQQMIPHHQVAVMMAQMLAVSTTRAEMKQLAENIIQSQTAEIENMRNWYDQWYK